MNCEIASVAHGDFKTCRSTQSKPIHELLSHSSLTQIYLSLSNHFTFFKVK